MAHILCKHFQRKKSYKNFFHFVVPQDILANVLSNDSFSEFALPGRGSGQRPRCCCGLGRSNDEDISLPEISFDQDEACLYYKIEFTSKMEQSWWSVGVSGNHFLIVKAVVQPPNVWFSHVKLKEALVDNCITTELQNDNRKIIMTIPKPDDTRWRMLGATQPDDNRIMPSTEAPLDFYPATIILREEVNPGRFLFGIQTGCEYQYGVPVGWHMMLKIGETFKPYTPIKFITQEQEEKYNYLEPTNKRSGVTVNFFLIRIVPDGEITPKLMEMEVLEMKSELELGSVVGRLDTDWFFETDRLIIFAGGTGISPWTSVIKMIKDRPKLGVKQVVLILSCRVSTPQDIIWYDVWENLSSLEWFFYVPYATLSDNGLSKRFTFESIDEDLEQLPVPRGAEKPLKQRAMACGPPGFTDSCLEICENLNMDDEDVVLFNG